MNKTKIEYLDYTWNPIAMKCSPVSEGCRNCWHLSMAKRLAGNPKMEAYLQRAYAGASPVLGPKELEAPFHLKKPARIGVQFMGDLFHPDVRCEWIDQIWEVMAACRWHTFFVLTKRPENVDRLLYGITENCGCRELGGGDYLKNVWFGVSVEDQETADKRITSLLKITAAHYWISHEPGLGLITYPKEFLVLGNKGLLVTGGETGSKARPMHPDIPRDDRDQCQVAGVPFFFKGWGSSSYEWKRDYRIERDCDWKKRLRGRLLDGREWNEMPVNSNS